MSRLSLYSGPATTGSSREYDDLAVIRLECCLERLKNFSAAVEASRVKNRLTEVEIFAGVTSRINRTVLNRDFTDAFAAGSLQPGSHLKDCHLYVVYETEKIPLDFKTRDGRDYHIVHKHYKPRKQTVLVSVSYREFEEDLVDPKIESEFEDSR